MANYVQLTPGAGRMYCGNCLRDNALVKALRDQGHPVLMVPLYLPLTLDEEDFSRETPIFFSGVNVYLDQKWPWFRRAPEWLRQWFTGRSLLGWVGRYAARTRAAEVGDMTVSMLRGENGNQARDLAELVNWLKTQSPPDALCLSNALLLGIAHQVKATFGAPVVCFLSGEDAFVDGMAEPIRSEVWELMGQRAQDIDRFFAPSRYFADRMADRLKVGRDRVAVLPVGINLDGFPTEPAPGPEVPTIGYLARMCPDKGLDRLVEAFIRCRQRGKVADVRLRVAGSCGPTDEPFVRQLKDRLAAAGCLDQAEFHPNLDRAAKVDFLRGLSVFSVPASYGEAFGLYLVEALAAGVPVVQPREAAFPELVEQTGGGRLFEPGDPEAYATALEELLLDPASRRDLASRGQRAVREQFSASQAARRFVEELEDLP
jgi:glycosyltransferase involved in cell wall biosynthesis